MKYSFKFLFTLLAAGLMLAGCQTKSDFTGVDPVKFNITGMVIDVPQNIQGKYRIYFNNRELGNITYFSNKDARSGIVQVYYDPLVNNELASRDSLQQVFETTFTAKSDNDTLRLIYYRGKILNYNPAKYTKSGFKVINVEGEADPYLVTFNNQPFETGVLYPFLLEDLDGELIIKNTKGEIVFQDRFTLPRNTEFTLLKVGENYVSLQIDDPGPATSETLKFRMIYFGSKNSMFTEDSYLMQYVVTDPNTADYTNPIFVSEEIVLKKGVFSPFFSVTTPKGNPRDVIFLQISKMDGTPVISLEDWWLFPFYGNDTGFECKFQSFDIGSEYGINSIQDVFW